MPELKGLYKAATLQNLPPHLVRGQIDSRELYREHYKKRGIPKDVQYGSLLNESLFEGAPPTPFYPLGVLARNYVVPDRIVESELE